MNVARISAAKASLFALLVAGASIAQEQVAPPAAESIELPVLIEKVRAAHWPTPPKDALDRFHAVLRYTPVRVQQDSVELDLDVTYLAPGFLRYKVDEPGRTLEQGWDDEGGWSLVDKQLTALRGKDLANDREQVKRRLGIARQLLRLLDPAAVLAALESPSAPARSRMTLSGKESAEVWVVRGELAEYPLLAPTADGLTTARVRLAVTVDAERGLVHAVEAQPLDEHGAPSGPTETVLLRDMVQQDGIVLPRELFFVRAREREARIRIVSIDLRPDAVTPATVRRPR